MEHVSDRLNSIRRTARSLLVAQRAMQWVAALLVVAVALGLIDFWLRVPGVPRLVIGLVVVIVAFFWLISRVGYAFGFRPPLSVLALRIEQMYPHLKGVLASGVEFAVAKAAGDPAVVGVSGRTDALVSAAIGDAERKLDDSGVSLGKVIDLSRTMRITVVAVAVSAGFIGIIAAAPEASATAAKRWLLPLGETAWPKRYEVIANTFEQVHAVDEPLRLGATVERNYYRGMRTWIRYRVVQPTGQATRWQDQLMNDQSPSTGGAGVNAAPAAMLDSGQFETLIDPATLGFDTSETSELAAVRATLEFMFIAGDDQTDVNKIELVSRPAVQSVQLTVHPPAYAQGLMSTQVVPMDQQTGQVATAAALMGSKVQLHIVFNKPIPTREAVLSKLAPGLPASTKVVLIDVQKVNDAAPAARVASTAPAVQGATATQNETTTSTAAPTAAPAAGSALANAASASTNDASSSSRASSSSSNGDFVQSVSVEFVIEDTVETGIHLRDEFGLENVSERRYRIEAVADQLPAASLLDPSADQSVTAEAIVNLDAMAQDDVAVSSLTLQATFERKEEIVDEILNAGEQRKPEIIELEQATGRSERLTAATTFDLARHSLHPGDVVRLHAVAEDIYELNGERHEAVKSTARVLRIIDEATLSKEIRSEIAAIRQQAVRTQQQQNDLLKEESAERAEGGQKQVTRSLQNQKALMNRLKQRMEANRFSDQGLEKLVEQAEQLMNQAESQSKEAEGNLNQSNQQNKQNMQQEAQESQEQARGDQEDVRDTLEDLIQRLDQGGEALALKEKLRSLAAQQAAIAQDTRQMLPETLGRDREELSDEQRQALDELAERQRDLEKEAEDLLRKMQSTAEALRQQEGIDAKAMAEAMRQAANTGQRQGLEQKMEESANEAQQNRLSESSNNQQQAQDTLNEMMDQMDQQERLKQEMLRRQLAKLIDMIKKLIEQQEAQLDRLHKAEKLAGLDLPLSTLRRNTLDVGDVALQARETADIGQHLQDAAMSQGEAIASIRDDARGDAAAFENQAVEQLRDALKLAEKINDENNQEQAQQERDELRKEYLRLAEEEEALMGETRPFTEKQLNRRDEARVRQLANTQWNIRQQAQELGEKVADTLVFRHMHGQIDDLAGDITNRMNNGEADALMVDDQRNIADTLRRMADALKEGQDDNEFAEEEQNQEQGEQGPSGPSGPPPLVPPVAELKLLKGAQEGLLDRTRRAGGDQEELKVDPGSLRRLGEQQRDLAKLGEELLRMLEAQQQQMQQQGPQIGPPQDVPDDL